MCRFGRFAVLLGLVAVGATEAGAQTPGATAPLLFRSMTPCRLVDTRQPSGGGAIASGETRVVPVWAHCGVPSEARAVYLNVTAVAPTGAGALHVWGDASEAPATPVVRYAIGATVAAGALVHLDSGELSVRPQQTESTTAHVVLDVVGYFEESAGDNFYGVVPCRILDTAAGSPAQPLASGQALRVAVAGTCAIPEEAKALAAVLTVTQATGLGHMTLFPAGTTNPGTSALTIGAGPVGTSGTIIALTAEGFDIVATVAGGGTAHLAIDVTGYYR